jgi:carboxylesterase
MKKKLIWISLSVIILLAIFVGLYIRTGFLQLSSIDQRDLSRWEYDGELIKETREFTLQGSNETCWYLIHGYTSTPDEMRELANKIYITFNDTVVVTRLEGHGMVPSKLLNLSLDDWYAQVSGEVDALSENCKKVNLVGFSFGGTLSTRLAEEKELNHIYLLAPYLVTTYKFYYGLRPEIYLKVSSPILHYSKKTKIGQINSPAGLEKHIAYWSMPFAPIKNSESFIKETINGLDKVSEPILLQHSKGDRTSDIESSQIILEGASSENKELIFFEKSNHILIEDYDKDQVSLNIIEFEKSLRI